jgi:hypothetical protein
MVQARNISEMDNERMIHGPFFDFKDPLHRGGMGYFGA